jgi:hypothetical protein
MFFFFPQNKMYVPDHVYTLDLYSPAYYDNYFALKTSSNFKIKT